ncbi:MAG: bifunctional 2-methylcitrate dehydratase/aconitate hydratase [Gammaproteobacteria bacterium]
MASCTDPDPLLGIIADYSTRPEPPGAQALVAARYCLMDALGCAAAALKNPECRRHIGPVVPGAMLAGGARVPGTELELDPVQAAYCIGCLVRWLDYNDTWLAAEWGHPSDNLGALLACADYISRRRLAQGGEPLLMRELLTALVKAYEIQGVLALTNSFNEIGIDHVILVRIASAALATVLMGGGKAEVMNAVSQALLDGGNLRAYRQTPDAGPRKSWAAGDATARGVRLALLTLSGEPGYPHALSAPRYGFHAALLRGKSLNLSRALSSYVVEHILFKVAYPCEFHAQTAAEAAIKLYPDVKDRLADIGRIVLATHESALRIIDKPGRLTNPADRDHCLQYVAAIGLLFGELQYHHFEDEIASDPRIDALRARMEVIEDPRYTRDYNDPRHRTVANRVTVSFRDGAQAECAVELPLGHPRRRLEALPLLKDKFKRNLHEMLAPAEGEEIVALFEDDDCLQRLSVSDFMQLWVPRRAGGSSFTRA